MAVPTTNVSWSSLQTEFSGANPISISEYYAGGADGYVPAGTQSPVDPSPVPSSGAIRIGEFRGCTSVTFPLSGGGASVYQTDGLTGGTSCHMIFTVDGTITFGGSGPSGTTTQYTGPSTWILPASTGIGSNYQIIVDSVSGTIGTPHSPTIGTWSAFPATFSASSGANAACSGGFNCRIRNATSLAVVSSFSVQVDTDNT